MLEHLFGSKTRVRLLRIFLHAPKQAFFVRELTRELGAQINGIRNELENLLDMGIIEEVRDSDIPEGEREAAASSPAGVRALAQRKYYRLNESAVIYPELKALFLKARMVIEQEFVQKIASSGNIFYMALTGGFVGNTDSSTDILIVGRANKDRIGTVIKGFEKAIGREINYTVMTPQEYKYRRDVTDRFLYSILEGNKIVVVDALQERMAAMA